MFGFKKQSKDVKDIDKAKLNEVIGLSKNVLRILYVLLIIVGVYALLMLTKELKILSFLLAIIKVVCPLFIGCIIAWLFDPLVKFLQKKGLRRGIGTLLTYLVIIGVLSLIIGEIIPLMSEQLNELIKTVPSIIDSSKVWLDGIFDNLKSIDGINIENVKNEIFEKIALAGANITANMPSLFVNIVKNFFSGMGNIVIGFIIGFYLLISFDNVNDTFITLFPKKMQKDTRDLVYQVNTSLRKFVVGASFDSSIIFVISAIGFLIAGLKAPFLFAFFCGITNVIPFAGPYIGGIPAVIVAFSQSTGTGIFVLLIIVVVQFLEGNFIQPLVMSKITKLHPVTIMIGLLVFGHFFGILGMFISTPVIAAVKSIIMFFDDKYDILKFNND